MSRLLFCHSPIKIIALLFTHHDFISHSSHDYYFLIHLSRLLFCRSSIKIIVLSLICRDYRCVIHPSLAESFISYIYIYLFAGVDSEGLYRVAGFHDDVEAIKMLFDKGKKSISSICIVILARTKSLTNILVEVRSQGRLRNAW